MFSPIKQHTLAPLRETLVQSIQGNKRIQLQATMSTKMDFSHRECQFFSFLQGMYGNSYFEKLYVDLPIPSYLFLYFPWVLHNIQYVIYMHHVLLSNLSDVVICTTGCGFFPYSLQSIPCIQRSNSYASKKSQ